MGPVYMDHYPAGSSTRAFVHFAQIYNNKGNFVKYDFGDPAEVKILQIFSWTWEFTHPTPQFIYMPN